MAEVSYLSRVEKFVNDFTPEKGLRVIFIASLYIITAKFGFSFAGATKQVTAVWPPTAIALTSLYLLGYKYWPGVYLGALIANIITNEPFFVAAGIAAGNTLGALAAVYMLRSLDFRGQFHRIRNVVNFIIYGAFVSTVTSASIGTLSLALGHLINFANFRSVWFTWWVGDTMGILIFAPLILVFTQRQNSRRFRQKPVEGAVVLSLIAITASSMFLLHSKTGFTSYLSPYMLFPLIFLVALELTQIGVAISTFIIAVLAMVSTSAATGPFYSAARTSEQNIIVMHLYLATVAITSLLTAAIVTERDRGRRLLEQQYASLLEAKLKIQDNLVKRREIQRQQNRLVDMASHELRTPLTAAKLYTDILKEENKSNGSHEVKRYTNKIADELDRLTKLTLDLLDVSRVRTGKIRIRKKSVFVDDFITKTARDAQIMAPKHKLVIKSRTNAVVFADQDRLRQVLINLLNNAINHSPVGSQITVSATLKNEEIIVEVHDLGVGIKKSERSRIFRPFYRTRKTKTRVPGGMGLGLYIALQIIDLHKGRLWVESNGSHGAIFAFSLPATKQGA